jgi:hypothetical protein
METKQVDSIVIAGVGTNTIENILSNNQSDVTNFRVWNSTRNIASTAFTGYSAVDSLQVGNIILQPSHPYLSSSLMLFRSMSMKGWILDEQRIDPAGNFYRITSRLTRRAAKSPSLSKLISCKDSSDSIYCSDYSPDLECWPLYRDSIACSHCSHGHTCARCRNWTNYLHMQRSDMKKRQQSPALNKTQQGNINSLLASMEQHLLILSRRSS